MKIGALLPMLDGVESPADTLTFARQIEALGYDYLVTYEHIILGQPTGRTSRTSLSHESFLHESLTLIAYLAAATRSLEFSTEVIVSPQRQTVLLAKQAAEVDYLSGGRLRLGIAAGWNPLEFEALSEDFHTRGQRLSEQIDVMRALWTQPVVDFKGRWHHIDNAGINPRPVQQPIPIWLGGESDAALRRAAMKGDGWLPLGRPNSSEFLSAHKKLENYLAEAGREPGSLGLEGQLNLGRVPEAEVANDISRWRALRATHLTVRTAGLGFESLQEHLDVLATSRELTKAG